MESLAFLPWTINAAPARASVPRSAVVAAILMATRSPAEDQRAALRAMEFLTHEMLTADGSTCLHELDKVEAFSHPYAPKARAQNSVYIWTRICRHSLTTALHCSASLTIKPFSTPAATALP